MSALSMRSILALLFLDAVASANYDICPGNKSACPTGATCCNHAFYNAYGCQFEPTGGCCAPGAALEPSKTMANCLIIGDSVSLGYTPLVAGIMARNQSCQVQHAPWVGGGSANNAANGLANLQHCRWLSTAMRPDVDVPWDIVQFNFGLHDLDKNTTEELDFYQAELENITAILLKSGAKHVQYATTTPFEPLALGGNDVVAKLNTRAAVVMNKHKVPMVDLNAVIHSHCGASYKSCPLCDDETKYHPGIYCGYHYTSAGYTILADAVAQSFEKLLRL